MISGVAAHPAPIAPQVAAAHVGETTTVCGLVVSATYAAQAPSRRGTTGTSRPPNLKVRRGVFGSFPEIHQNPTLGKALLPALDGPYEITDSIDVIGYDIRQLEPRDLIFNRDYQFEAIQPVCPEVIAKARVVSHALSFDAEMAGYDLANF
jgi:hypothetical protein